MQKAPDKQVSLTDPDVRSMKSRGNGIVGYNASSQGLKTVFTWSP